MLAIAIRLLSIISLCRSLQDGKRLWRKARGRAPLEPLPSMLPVLSKKDSDVLGLDFQPRVGDSTGPTS